MRETMLDFLDEYGIFSFRERPLGEVDSLILSQLAYLKFDDFVPSVHENKPSVSITDIYHSENYEHLYTDKRYEKQNRMLFEKALQSRRYCDMKLNCYINIIEKDRETQFAAVTFLLENNTIFVAFRGTDETIIGWKEDFNMAFLTPVPGQELSVKYLNIVTSRFRVPFYVGGHSKGGNLAVFSAMHCKPKVQERIQKIYNMDGPGFRQEILADCGFGEIEEKVEKYLPHSSVVGMLLENHIPYTVVDSKYMGIAQHDPFSWVVKDGAFVKTQEISKGRKILDASINEWILSLNQEQLHIFVDNFYGIVCATEADDLMDFTVGKRKKLAAVVNALKDLDGDTRKAMLAILLSLFEIAGGRVLEKTAEKTVQLLEKIEG